MTFNAILSRYNRDFLMKRIIFLDIDGVFNSELTKFLYGDRSSPYDLTDFATGGKELTHEILKFNPTSVDLFGKILKHDNNGLVNVKVVISSDWRIYLEVEDFIKIFKVYGLDLTDYLIGMTPYIDDGTRGDEINKWKQDNGYSHCRNIIIDDYPDFSNSNLTDIHMVNPKYGLTFDDYERICVLCKNQIMRENTNEY